MITQEHIEAVLQRFKTDAELQADEQFQTNLRNILRDCYNRPTPPAGKRWVRGAWEYFNEHVCFHMDTFLVMNNAITKRIGHKLPMNVREYAKAIMSEAIRKTVIYYAEVESKKAES